MVSLKQLILFAAIFNSIWGFANQQKVLQEIVQEKETDGVFGNHNTFGDESDPASPHVQIFWKDEKSTPPGWNTHKSPDNEILLDFDDIQATEPLTNITSYKSISFASFKVLNVPLAIKAGIIDLEDADDSLSAPNAILGSQNSSSTSHPVIPWIYVTSNCTSQSQSSDYPTDFPYNFQPISMRVKPIRMIEERSLVIIGINGWELDGKEVVNVYGAGIVWGGPGHVRSFRLGMGHWGRKEGEKGRGVNVLEIKCYVYEGKREERRFVVDDLVVSVLDTEEEEGDRDARSEL